MRIILRTISASFALAALTTFSFANVNPAHAATVVLPHGAPACQSEDGSGQRVCVWDAHTMGNGIGHSVVIRHGGTDNMTITYASQHRVHLLLDAWCARKTVACGYDA